MDNVNPLGQIMHLRELDRQATPQLTQLRSRGMSKPILARIAGALRFCRGAFTRQPLTAPCHSSLPRVTRRHGRMAGGMSA